jgi:hypothetical protein
MTVGFVVTVAGVHLVYMLKMHSRLMVVTTMRLFGLISILGKTLAHGYQ